MDQVAEAPEVQKSDAQIYLEASQARDITVPSGLKFRVRGMTQAEYGEVMGSLPALVTGEKNGKPRTKDEQDKAERAAQDRAIYERFVEGLVDRVTGEITKIPYEKLLLNDGVALGLAVMTVGGLDTPKADQIRRSLPES